MAFPVRTGSPRGTWSLRLGAAAVAVVWIAVIGLIVHAASYSSTETCSEDEGGALLGIFYLVAFFGAPLALTLNGIALARTRERRWYAAGLLAASVLAGIVGFIAFLATACFQ